MLSAEDKRQALLISLLIFALALTVRILFAFQWQDTPYGNMPLLDARAYDDWAQAIAAGHWLRATAFYQSPLYPYLLAGIYQIFGHDFLAVSIFNALLDAGTAVVLARIAFMIWGRNAAIITGLLTALYAPMIFYTAPPMKEPLALFLLSLFLFYSARSIRNGKNRDYALTGLTLGFATLARGNALFLLPVVPLVILWRTSWKEAYKLVLSSACWIFGLFLIAVVPATIHNYAAAHDFVPLTYSGGFNLYIGHSAIANGTNAYPPEVSTDPVQEELNTKLIASRDAGHPLKPSEISRSWEAKALNFAIHNPLREIQLLGLKIFAFWNGAESFDNYDITFIRTNFPTLLNLPLLHFPFIAMLAAFGLITSWRSNRHQAALFTMAIGLYMLSVVLFYVTDRYRLPVIVFLLPLAGGAIPEATALWRGRNVKVLAFATIAALLFLIVGLAPAADASDLLAFDYGTLVAVYADKGESDNAIITFNKGYAISNTGIGSQAYVRAAEVEEKRGHARAAQRLIEQMAELFPEDGIAQYNLGRLQAQRGDLSAALWSFKTAERLSPSYGLTYYALAVIYNRMGDKGSAQKAVTDGLAVNSEDQRLLAMEALLEK